ncbi:sensor histidine kinase [Beijerinckia mobilis]|uniref:sensor histidine kinase n=1 Tax=Beijerinckia mobilis TaxID=231434 RepID=UPI000691E599|nr:HAMP domain-containing sensor histidine kinase [Beijerinckia mobilis]
MSRPPLFLRRLSLSARLGLIGFIGIINLWLISLALFYVRDGQNTTLAVLPPERVAVIATLIDNAVTEQERSVLLSAVNGPALHSSIESEARLDDGRPLEPQLAQAYRAVLGERMLAVARPPRPSPFEPLKRLRQRLLNEFDLVIALHDGQRLVLAARVPPSISPFGLPIGLLSGLIAAIIALIVLLGVTHETRPLRQLARALDHIDLDGTATPVVVPSGGAPEIRSLADAFTRLQKRISGLLRARMALIGGISHDLRTCATRLRLRVEAIPDPHEKLAAIGDIKDMIRLLDDSLLATQAGAGQLQEEWLDLEAITLTEAEARRRAGAPVRILHRESAPILGDSLALRRIVANLVDNALKYGACADLSLKAYNGLVRLVVEDRGPGIAPEAREAVMEPFTRLEPSRSRQGGGAGLGLAIARNLARAQGGDIEIADRPGGGARVSLILPVFNPSAGL